MFVIMTSSMCMRMDKNHSKYEYNLTSANSMQTEAMWSTGKITLVIIAILIQAFVVLPVKIFYNSVLDWGTVRTSFQRTLSNYAARCRCTESTFMYER